MPVTREDKEKFRSMIERILDRYENSGFYRPDELDEILTKYREAKENASIEEYDVYHKFQMDDIQQFKLPKEVGGIPLIYTDENGKWIAKYPVPKRVVKAKLSEDERNRIEGWKDRVISDASYRPRNIDATNMNQTIFKEISDTFKVINVYDNNLNPITLTKQQLQQVAQAHRTGFGFVLLDKDKIALVPYMAVFDKHAQTFYSFEFETGARDRQTQNRILNNYRDFLVNEFTERKGFKPPIEELSLSRIRAYLDVSAHMDYPVEMVHTGFSLPTAIFFAHHWTEIIKPHLDESALRGGNSTIGMHISATTRLLNRKEMQGYLYAINLFDTLIRPKERRRSHHYLESVMGNRGLFRWEGNTRLEVRYPAPYPHDGYIANQMILVSKYVRDINLLKDMGVRFNISEKYSEMYPLTSLRFNKQMYREYLNFYTDNVLGLSPAEKELFYQHIKFCNER